MISNRYNNVLFCVSEAVSRAEFGYLMGQNLDRTCCSKTKPDSKRSINSSYLRKPDPRSGQL